MSEDKNEVSHQDGVANSSTEDIDRSASVDSQEDNSHNSSKDLNPGQITSEQFGKDYNLSHPSNPDELPFTWQLHYFLREANLEKGSDIADRSPEEEDEIEVQFDQSVFEYASRAFKASGLDLASGSHPVKHAYILVLLLKEVRKCSLSDLETHLEEYETLQLDRGQSASAISRRKQELEEVTLNTRDEGSDTDHERSYLYAIREAAFRITYALYRNGVQFPESVISNHHEANDQDSPIVMEEECDSIEEGTIGPRLQDEALQNWVNLFFEKGVFDPLRFDRAGNATFPFASFIGLLAHSTLQSTSILDGDSTCAGWYSDYDLVPSTGETISKQITSMNIGEIEGMFRKANKRLFDVVSEYAIFDSPHRIAFDPTSVPIEEDLEDDPWVKGHAESLKGEVEPSEIDEVEFGVLGLIESDIRMVIGLYPIAQKSHNVGQHASLEHTLRPVITDSPVTVYQIVMDRGLVGADFIDHLRGLIGEHWFMHATRYESLKKYIEKTPEDEPKYYPDIDFLNDLDDKPNALVVPIHEDESDTDRSQRMYLTDLSKDEFVDPSTGEIDVDRMNFIYRNRRRIETTIGQVKHDFKIPSKNASSVLEYYYLNLAILFFNFYNLINNSLSPKYAFPLGASNNISPNEVLSAVRHVAFQHAREAPD